MTNSQVTLQRNCNGHVDGSYQAYTQQRVGKRSNQLIERVAGKTLVGDTDYMAKNEESVKAGKNEEEIVENFLTHARSGKQNKGEDISKQAYDSHNGQKNSTDPKVLLLIAIFPVDMKTVIKRCFISIIPLHLSMF